MIEEITEQIFEREYCPLCTYKVIAIFKIIDSRVCLFCLDILKRNSKQNVDQLHTMTLDHAKKYYAGETPPKPLQEINESPNTQPAEVPRRRGRPKKIIR